MKTRAHITLVVDRSRSMLSIKEEAEGGIQKFVDEQCSIDDAKVRLSLYEFDNEFAAVFEGVKIADAPAYRIDPRGMTALYDAVGLAIAATNSSIEAAKNKPDKVVVVIMTDGEENASNEYDFASVSKLIEEYKAKGWQFVFLAGSVKAKAFGHASGLRTTGYDPSQAGQTQNVYAAASASTRSFIGGQTAAVDMPDQVDDAAADPADSK